MLPGSIQASSWAVVKADVSNCCFAGPCPSSTTFTFGLGMAFFSGFFLAAAFIKVGVAPAGTDWSSTCPPWQEMISYRLFFEIITDFHRLRVPPVQQCHRLQAPQRSRCYTQHCEVVILFDLLHLAFVDVVELFFLDDLIRSDRLELINVELLNLLRAGRVPAGVHHMGRSPIHPGNSNYTSPPPRPGRRGVGRVLPPATFDPVGQRNSVSWHRGGHPIQSDRLDLDHLVIRVGIFCMHELQNLFLVRNVFIKGSTSRSAVAVASFSH